MFHGIGLRAAIALAASIAFGGTAYAGAVAGQGTWETTLQARDVNGDGVADAYYDTVLKITWLADGRAVAGTPYETNLYAPGSGAATFANARAWSDALDV